LTTEEPIRMPQMGESIAEGTLVKWHKKVGDKVSRDETLFEISTDKVDTEVPSPRDGYILRILVKEGETVPVHTVVCLLGGSQPAQSTVAAPTPAVPLAEPAPARESVSTAAPAAQTAAPGGRESAEDRLREKSSPLVRRLAAEHGIVITSVAGSGTGGRVTKEDILRHITEKPSGAASSFEDDRIEPMTVMRQRIAEHMVASRRTAAHVSTIFEVDLTEVRKSKDSLSPGFAEKHGVKLTYLPFVLSAVSKALRKHPKLNASIEGKSIRYHGEVNLGIAVALDDGLIVPVVRRADRLDLEGLARAVGDLAQRARSKQLKPEEVQGGTFTVTNPGVFGSLIGTPIISQPQVAILCLGAVTKRPVVLEETDAIAIRSMAYLSLSFDHRLIDGAVADRFMAELKTLLETPTV